MVVWKVVVKEIKLAEVLVSVEVDWKVESKDGGTVVELVAYLVSWLVEKMGIELVVQLDHDKAVSMDLSLE